MEELQKPYSEKMKVLCGIIGLEKLDYLVGWLTSQWVGWLVNDSQVIEARSTVVTTSAWKHIEAREKLMLTRGDMCKHVRPCSRTWLVLEGKWDVLSVHGMGPYVGVKLGSHKWGNIYGFFFKG